jgi:MerR HTH family regulatory protein
MRYYSITEVGQMLNVSVNQLRYLEKNTPKLEVLRIKNRRYYTKKDIETLRSKIGKNIYSKNTEKDIDWVTRIKQIDILIDNFSKLLQNIPLDFKDKIRNS